MRILHRLNRKILLLTLVVGLVPVVILGSVLNVLAQREIEKNMETLLGARAHRVQDRLAEYLQEREQQAEILRLTPIFHESAAAFRQEGLSVDDASWQARMKRMDRLAPQIVERYRLNSFFISDANGILIYDANPEIDIPLGLDFMAVAEHFDATLRTSLGGQLAWSRQHYSPVSDSTNLIVSVPLLAEGDHGQVVGTLNLSVGQADIDALIHAGLEGVGETANAYLLDEEGVLRSHAFRGKTLLRKQPLQDTTHTKAATRAAELLRQGEDFSCGILSYDNEDGLEVVGHVSRIFLGETPTALVLEMEDAEVYQGLTLMRSLFISLIFLASACILLAAIWFSRTITRPVEAMSAWAGKLAQGDYEDRKVFGQHREIEDLSRAMVDMADKVQERENELQSRQLELKAGYQQIVAYSEEVQTLNAQLEHQAWHDPLTGLANRHAFADKLNEQLQAKREGAVALLDLDDFKEINDTAGHVFGDRILHQVGQRLQRFAKAQGLFIARYGGDEFLLLLPGQTTVPSIRSVIRRLSEVMTPPYAIGSDAFRIAYTLGIAVYPSDGQQTAELIACADTAMYQAKATRGVTYLFYHRSMRDDLVERRRIKDVLNRALDEDLFSLVYQPQVDLSSGRVACFEALLRLDESLGLSPGTFIPVAEGSEQIVRIGRYVAQAAIRQIAKWQKEGHGMQTVSVNFSTRQLQDRSFPEFLANVLARENVSPQCLEIEITESIFLEKTLDSLSFLAELKELGVSIALDDFGSGYSSLSYLTFIQLDKIKLDRAFVHGFLQKPQTQALRHVIALLHSMSFSVTAEGVEKEAVCRMLQEMGCDMVQGYWFSRPVWPDKAIPMTRQAFELPRNDEDLDDA